METMLFTYNLSSWGAHTLKFETQDGLDLTIYFSGLEAEIVIVNDNAEHDCGHADTKGLYVKHDDKFYTIHHVVNYAQECLPGILDQNEQEAADEALMYKELSSPYLTGRI